MKKTLLGIALAAILALSGCAMQTATVTHPAVNPTAGLILGLQTASAACVVAAPNISDAVVAQWMGGCSAAINTAIATIQAPGFDGKTSAALQGIQQFLATEPTGISANDLKWVNTGVALINVFIADYQADFPTT